MSPLPSPTAGPSEAPGERSVADRRRAGSRVLAVSLAVSVLLHVLVIVLFPTFYAVGPGPPDRSPAPGDAFPDAGIEVVGLAEVPEVEVEPLPRPVEPTTPEEPPEEDDEAAEEPEARAQTEGAPPDEGTPGDEGLPSVAERLRTPTRGDARLWRPIDPDLTALTPDERALIAIYIELRNMADSVFAAEQRERQAREWVFTDDEGRRWGISPGTIYLGDDSVQVPLLDQLQFTRPRTVESMRRQWELDDINRAADVARVRDAWDERREAIRERRDAEREEARAQQSRPSEPADSSGSGS